MALAAGTRLGPYQIVALLGAGGAGEVYRARDGRLGRDVAVKVLPNQLADHADRRRRFELEARAAGALNHPSVLAVLDVGAEGSTAYLVTELLDGETMRDKLAAGTPPLPKAIEWGVQIARGLAAAHDKGIVHRDLKPENLFVTRDGRVKILDFGLAKAITVDGAATDSGTDSTLPADLTESGAVLGTAGYMAPEQVMGKSVDARTDLFALGAVLYELLTGRRAFGDGTPVERAYAILKDDPPAPTKVNPAVSPALELVVRRCLEKNPEERFQSARDLAFHLQSLSTISGLDGRASLVPALSARRVPRAALVGAAIAVAATAAIAAYAVGWRGGHPAPPVVGATLASAAKSPAQPRYTRLTFRRGMVTNARFLPDGTSILYSAVFVGGRPQILTVTAGQPESRVLGDNVLLFAAASTGELAVAIPSQSAIAPPILGRMALAASTPRAVLDGVSHADWAPDGTHLAVVLDDGAGQRLEYPIGHVLARVTGEIGALRVSPDGKLVAFLHWPTWGDDRGTVELVDAQGARRTTAGPFLALRGLAWSSDSRELWFSAPLGDVGGLLAIHAVALDGQDRVVATAPARVTLLDRAADGRILVSVENSRHEMHFHGPGDAGDRELSWFDGSMLTDVSVDGKTLLFAEGDQSITTEGMIYTRPTSGGPAVPLGTGSPYALSPDGKWVLAAPQIPKVALELLPTGAGQPRVLSRGPIAEYGDFGGFFPNGERIWFLARDHEVLRLWVQDLAAVDPRPLVDRAVFVSSRALSPDGRTFLLGDPSEGSFFELDAAGGAARPQTLPVGAFPIGWTSDGGLYLARQSLDTSWVVTRWNRTTRREQPVRTLRADYLILIRGGSFPSDPVGVPSGGGNFLFSPDGSWYVFEYPRVQSDLYLVDGLK